MAQEAKQPSKMNRLTTRMERYASAERLFMMRNLGYGGAAACLVILVQLAQVGAKDFSLQVTIVATSIDMPLWLTLGGIYEAYILLGKQGYPHLRTDFAKKFIGLVGTTAGIVLTVAIGGLIWYLMPSAVLVFAITIVICVALSVVYQLILARWWFGPEGPGSREREDEV